MSDKMTHIESQNIGDEFENAYEVTVKKARAILFGDASIKKAVATFQDGSNIKGNAIAVRYELFLLDDQQQLITLEF